MIRLANGECPNIRFLHRNNRELIHVQNTACGLHLTLSRRQNIFPRTSLKVYDGLMGRDNSFEGKRRRHRAALAMDHRCIIKVCWFVVAIAKGRHSQSKIALRARSQGCIEGALRAICLAMKHRHRGHMNQGWHDGTRIWPNRRGKR